MTNSTGMNCARKLREKFELSGSPCHHIPMIFQTLGIQFQEAPLDGCLGMTLRFSNQPITVVISSKIIEPGRRIFTAAHELVHACIPTHNNRKFSDSENQLFSYDRSKKDPLEIEADDFAAEWLMPEQIFRERLLNHEPGFALVRNLAEDFATTMTATAARMVDLSDHALMLVVSDGFKMKYFRPSTDFPYRLDFGILPDTHAKMASPPDEFMSVPSHHWFSGSRQPDNEEVLEWSVRSKKYGIVLTLLWADE